jgi:diguanylate cyclase (GGDEF)-like protein
MRAFRRAGASAPTLHQAWTRTVVTLLLLVFGLGLLSLVATQYQRVEFQDSTSALRAETSALASLSYALVEVNGAPTVAMLYGSPKGLAKNRAAYAEIRGRVNTAFLAAAETVSTAPETATLTRAHRTWQALDSAIIAAPSTYSHRTALNGLAAGNDPFQRPVWERLNATEAEVANVAQLNAARLGKQPAAVGRIEGLIPPVVLVAIGLALLMCWLAARRLSRLVLAPIVTLRHAALGIGGTTAERDIELPGGAAELQDLATTINERAASLRSSHGRLRDQAYTDALTNLPNRKAFIERLHAILAETRDARIAVLFVDLDDFKVVNDSLGHAAGDELLRVAANRLLSASSGCEIVARLGGDEFAVALDCSDHDGLASAVAVAERILEALQGPVSIEGTTLSVTASIGVAISEAPPGTDAADALLRNADFSMYLAKGQGKNRLEVFAPSMHAEMVGRIAFKHELRQATQLGQFVLYYQPVIDLSSGGVIGFEALIRWQHPIRGLLAPAEFIALAEDTGDIVEIGRWVIDQACRDLADRRMQRDGSSDLWMSVNVSAHQLVEPTFADSIKATLLRYAIPPSCLILELTESVAITNTATSASALAELRRHGVHVALDDFGMGFSSLRYLHELPIDVIKIDRTFVIDHDGETHSMLEAIVTMGQALGLTVIAEGIEQRSELERLVRFGPVAGQGYFIGRPMSAPDAANFLRHNVRPSTAIEPAAGVPVPNRLT